MKKESMRMKKDIRAYEYEELQKELERSRRKTVSGKTAVRLDACQAGGRL